MVQIIQERPKETFGDRFARAFGNAAGSAAQEIPQALIGRAERKQLGDLIGQDVSNIRNPDIQKLLLQGRLAQQLEEKKLAGKNVQQKEKLDFLNKIFNKGQPQQNIPDQMSEGGGFDASNIPDEVIALAASEDPNVARSLQHAKDVAIREKREQEKLNYQKEQDLLRHEKEEKEFAFKKNKPSAAEEQEKVHNRELLRKKIGYEKTLKELEDMLPYTGATFIPGTKSFAGKRANRGAVQKRSEFDVLAFSLEGFLREMATKGTLPQGTFQTLLSKLPSSTLSERENKGRISAIRKIVNRFLPSEEGIIEEESFTPVILTAPNGRKVQATSREQLELFRQHGAK